MRTSGTSLSNYPLIKLCGKFWSQCSSTEHCILEAFGSKCVCLEPRLRLCSLPALFSSASDFDAVCDVLRSIRIAFALGTPWFPCLGEGPRLLSQQAAQTKLATSHSASDLSSHSASDLH